MQGTAWYVNDGNGPQGPLQESEVVGLLVAQRIRPTALFAPSGSQAWLRLDQVPAFHQAAMRAMSPGAPGAPMMPAPMMHRPVPPRAKSSSGAGVAIAAVVCLALAGLFGVRLLGRGYGSRPQVEATVEKSKVSKDGKSVTVTLDIKSEVKGKVDVTAYGGTRPLKQLDVSDVEDGVVKAKFDVADLPAGDNELKLTVSAEGFMANYGIVTTVTMPPRIVVSTNRVWVDGRRGSVELADGSFKISGDKGTKISVGGKQLTATGTDTTSPLDLVSLLEKTDLGQLSSSSFKVPVTFTFEEGDKLAGDLVVGAAAIEKAVLKSLAEVKKGPVSFGKSDEAPKKPRVLADVSGTSLKLHGGGTGIKSVDLVADAEYVTRTGSCGTYRSNTTGEVVSISREMNDKRYTVYERRTGKVVGTRLFVAPLPACPEVMNREETVSSYPDDGAINDYLASLVKR